MKYFPLILLGVFLNAAAQILLKKGMTDVGNIAFTWKEIGAALPRVATSLPILAGFACYAISVIVWLGVLNKVEASLAYPMLSFGFVAVLAWYWLAGTETIGWERILGVLLVCCGIFFLYRSA